MDINLGIIVGILIALSEFLKKLGLEKKLLPISNVLFGIIAGFVYLEGEVKIRILCGIIAGLTASGVFDLTKMFKKEE